MKGTLVVLPRVQSKNSYRNKAPTYCVRKWFDVLSQSDLFLLLIYYSYIKEDSFSRLIFCIAVSKYGLLIWQTPLSLYSERSLLTIPCSIVMCLTKAAGSETRVWTLPPSPGNRTSDPRVRGQLCGCFTLQFARGLVGSILAIFAITNCASRYCQREGMRFIL